MKILNPDELNHPSGGNPLAELDEKPKRDPMSVEPPVDVMGGYVLLVAEEPEEKSAGGILVPESARQEGGSMSKEAQWGVIIAIGPGHYHPDHPRSNAHRIPIADVQLGDRVIYWPSMTLGFLWKGEHFILCPEDNILAVRKEAPEGQVAYISGTAHPAGSAHTEGSEDG